MLTSGVSLILREFLISHVFFSDYLCQQVFSFKEYLFFILTIITHTKYQEEDKSCLYDFLVYIFPPLHMLCSCALSFGFFLGIFFFYINFPNKCHLSFFIEPQYSTTNYTLNNMT